jgi:hypothetical protein
LAVEEEGGKGSFFLGRLNLALKKISAGLRPVRAIQVHATLEVAIAGREFESLLDEGIRTLAG